MKGKHGMLGYVIMRCLLFSTGSELPTMSPPIHLEVPCRECGRERNVWMEEEPMDSGILERYKCLSCGREWTEALGLDPN